MWNAKTYGFLAGIILLLAAMVIFHAYPTGNEIETRLSAIVLIGLGLTVVFMAILAITYSVLGIGNREQALGLPEGSIRALLAFSLVLIFVLLSTSLFSAVNTPVNSDAGRTLTRVTDAQLSDLKANFIVAAQQARTADDKPIYEQIPDPTDADKNRMKDDLRHPIYSVTYFPKRNADATDFAKQIFTTLATIFVSVVSFYFGSSVTASASAAGAKNAIGAGADKKAVALQSALTAALADSHAAQITLDQAALRLKAAQDADASLSTPDSQAALAAAQKAVADARKNLQDKQAAVQTAQNAVKDYPSKAPAATEDPQSTDPHSAPAPSAATSS